MNEADIKPGLKFKDVLGEIRVMAVAEKYAMCRRPHAIPFVWSFKELIERSKGEKIKIDFFKKEAA